MENEGRRCILIRGDLEAEAHCLEVVQKTVDAYGRIDVLVNNAAFQVLVFVRVLRISKNQGQIAAVRRWVHLAALMSRSSTQLNARSWSAVSAGAS